MDSDTGIDAPDNTGPDRIAPGGEAASFCATLVDEWIRMGATHAVVAPGSRSTPLAVALAARSELALQVFHDERSAAFAALGIGMASGRPAILLCTSGTAAAHFHAAVIEAHQSDVPMIVCTADRPPELRDVAAPQTIDQTKLYGDAVRWFHDPGVASPESSHTWRALAARCVLESTGRRPGPVHLNLPFREPLVGAVAELPPARTGAWSTQTLALAPGDGEISSIAARLSGRRGVVVAGRGATREVTALAVALGWPVLVDPLSGARECRPNVVAAFDPILRSGSAARALSPEVVVRVGQPPASKVFAQWIAACSPELVQISAVDSVVDPDHRVAVRVVGDVDRICGLLAAHVVPTGVDWSEKWLAAETAAQAAISRWCATHWSEPTVARTVTDSVGSANLVVSSSMPIRDVEWFGTVTPDAAVHANRGANGIDGVVSTAVGVALATREPTVLLIGDVALLHASNGLIGLTRRDVGLTIVVTNNDGGSIFSFLPQAGVVDGEVFESIYGTPHGVSFASLAAAHGIDHVEVHDAGTLAGAVAAGGTKLVEARFPRGENVAVHDDLNRTVVEAVESVLAP